MLKSVCRVLVNTDKFDIIQSQDLTIKPTRCPNFSNLFLGKTLHVSASSSVLHQEFFTVHMAMVYVIHVCWQFKLSANLNDIYHCCVYGENS